MSDRFVFISAIHGFLMESTCRLCGFEWELMRIRKKEFTESLRNRDILKLFFEKIWHKILLGIF